MDERKNHRRPKNKPASIDGIVTDGRRLGLPTHRAYRPSQGQPTPTLGDVMGAEDGFRPLRQAPRELGQSPETAEAEALLDEPIVLDDVGEEVGKKRRFGLKRPGLRLSLKRAGLSLLALVLLGAAFFGIKLYITEKHLFRGGGKAPALAENIDINQLKGEGDGRVNVLILGIGGPGHDGPDLTDTILLASIDPINHNTALLSIPRDLWVKIPSDGYQKINAAYPFGKQESKSKTEKGKIEDGLNKLDDTLTPVLGIPIHYHVIVDFAAFEQAINAVGGISFYVPEMLYDPTIAWENNYNPVIAPKGYQTFNGHKALLYAKSRETSSDFARSQRQRQIMVALKDKILSLGTFSNPIKVSQLLSSFGNNIYTDFSLSDIMRVYQIMGQIPSNNITSLDLVTPPHDLLTTGTVNELSVVEPTAGLFIYKDIQNYVRNALRDGFIAKENAQVAIYNATDVTGLATKLANTLKSYGYNVTTVSNTPAATNPPRTTLIDLSKGSNKYTKHYLEERFKATAQASLPPSLGINPPSGTSFVIILGKDVANSGQN